MNPEHDVRDPSELCLCGFALFWFWDRRSAARCETDTGRSTEESTESEKKNLRKSKETKSHEHSKEKRH